MRLYVVIPVKGLNEAKGRLAGILSQSQRRELCICMFRDVALRVLDTENVEGLVVVSPDREIVKISRSLGADVLVEEGNFGVNRAVSKGINRCLNYGATAILILPADIPLILEEDIKFMARLGWKRGSAVICPSLRLDGTNALLLNPPRLMDTSYDRDSFRNHLAAGFGRGVKVMVYLSPRLMLDIDTPEDLRVFMSLEAGRNTETYSFCLRNLGGLC